VRHAAVAGRTRLLRATLGNAVTWGVAWGALGFAGILGLRTAGVVVPASISALDALGMAIRIGIVGGITGGVFAAVLRLAYRGRRLRDLDWRRFGVVGGVVGAGFVLAWMQGLRALAGEAPAPWVDIRGDLVMATLFGSVTAAGMLRLAQRSEAREGVEAGAPHASLGDGDASGVQVPVAGRARR
jgi:hypothetical protein